MGKFNNIDDAIRNGFEDFDMPFDASQWDALNSKLDQSINGNSFDNKVKDSLNNHQVAYDPAAWTALESQLISSVSYTKWFIAAGVVGMLSLGYFLLSDSSTENSKAKTKEESTEKLTANKEESNIELRQNTEESKNIISENNVASTSNSVDESQIKNSNSNNGNSINGNTNSQSNNLNTSSNNTTNNNSNSSNSNNGNSVIKTNNDPIVLPQPVRSFSVPVINGNTEVCQGTELKLTSSDLSGDVSAQWFLNGMVIGEENEIILKNLVPGTHELELVHSATKNTSLYQAPVRKATKLITVKESPNADFNYAEMGDASYPEMKLNVLNPEKDVNYVWMMDNKSFTGEEIIYLFKNKGVYPIQLLAETSNGCSRIETKNIEISNDYNLLAPIAFTPNADGHNDVFIPEALKVLNLSFKMNIYDRQQGLVYQSNRVDNPWDGKNMNNGEFCNQGAYRWVVELTTKDGKIEFYQGTITLLK